MNNSKKAILICILSIFITSSFLIPPVRAKEWIYNGVDTERIPNFFVFPSERYYYNYTGSFADEIYIRLDVLKGNFTDSFYGLNPYFGLTLYNGSCIWGDLYTGNATSGSEVLSQKNAQFAYWNETVGLISIGFLPVDTTGEATVQSLEAMLETIQRSMEFLIGGRFEHNAIYPDIYSMEVWNSSYNNAYQKINFTENGHLIKSEVHKVLNSANVTLISRPAQMSPVFTFSTDDDILAVNSTNLTLVVNITDADNNNDKVIDTDYQYRIYNGTSWTAWTAIPATINYNFGNVATGNYDITMEVKNMYGISSHQIQIQYTAPNGNGGALEIAGFSIILTSIALLLGISFLIQKNRKNRIII